MVTSHLFRVLAGLRTHSPKGRNRLFIAGLLVLAVAFLGLAGSSSIDSTVTPHPGGVGAGAEVLPAVDDPVPPDKPAATPAATPKATATSATPVPTATAPATPTLTKADKKALDIVDYHWDVFVLALGESKGTKLTASQLKKPSVIVVAKASCKQHGTNVLGPKSRASLTYCKGKLELVPSVFLTITEPGQLKVVASAFLYHALDTTTAKQRKYETGVSRNDKQVLGCLQGQLSQALERYQAISDPAEAWVVLREGSKGGDLHNSYYATYYNNGVWS